MAIDKEFTTKALTRAYELVERNHIVGDWIKSADNTIHTNGWWELPDENSPDPQFGVCAVGGIERAVWELMGKPDMSNAHTYKK